MTSPPRPNHLTETLLATYDVPEEVRQGIADAGFLYATPIQAKALPIALAGTVLLAQDAALTDVVRGLVRGQPCPSSESFYRLRSAGLVRGDSQGS